MCKHFLWVGCFQEENRVFILYEHNEEVHQNGRPFWTSSFLIYVHDTIIL